MSFGIWDLVAYACFLALLYAGPVLLAVAVLLLAVPAIRRRTGWRRTAYVLLGIEAALIAGSTPVFIDLAHQAQKYLKVQAATYHLSAPRTFAGTTFPAGSTVHLREDGMPDYGVVPVATTILGLPLAGRFSLGNLYGGSEVGINDATLAAPAVIGGIPCGTGALTADKVTTRCVLARDYTFAGHRLAMGEPVKVNHRLPNQPDELVFGTLAQPELLFGTTWPAGTILIHVAVPPEQMVDGSEPELPESIQICLPPGLAMTIPGATLHGFISYGVYGTNRIVTASCLLPDSYSLGHGYAEVGPDRYSHGERGANGTWKWTQQIRPAQAP